MLYLLETKPCHSYIKDDRRTKRVEQSATLYSYTPSSLTRFAYREQKESYVGVSTSLITMRKGSWMTRHESLPSPEAFSRVVTSDHPLHITLYPCTCSGTHLCSVVILALPYTAMYRVLLRE